MRNETFIIFIILSTLVLLLLLYSFHIKVRLVFTETVVLQIVKRYAKQINQDIVIQCLFICFVYLFFTSFVANSNQKKEKDERKGKKKIFSLQLFVTHAIL